MVTRSVPEDLNYFLHVVMENNILKQWGIKYVFAGSHGENNLDVKNLPWQHNVSYRGNLLKLD